MQLQSILDHYHALADRVPMRFWGEEETTPTPMDSCGYCADGRKCRHADDGLGAMRPMPSNRRPDVNKLQDLIADVDRVINDLPGRASEMFHRRYRVRVMNDDHDGRGVMFRSHTDGEVMAMFAIRQTTDYWNIHQRHMKAMERRLVDWLS